MSYDDRYVFPVKLLAVSSEQQILFRQLYNYERIDFDTIPGFTTRDAERLVEDVLTVRALKFPEVKALLGEVDKNLHRAKNPEEYKNSVEHQLAEVVKQLFPNSN